ncbi:MULTISPECIES: M14 family metallopeptidase [unclassified Bacillus (in: firmicutes)]|uniref:M14 family metallopeptidase n=1 Tax=unclassified Bacillus (in: firmicutes) TaxID=185979 RepID=UPI0008E316FC|nr:MULTISPECIES: M14 family metallopeptidase [unclassified Bacillus (in: firmicutes)]SFA96260.1 g-D-glutamyl-meso-diaminopimelate peptidase [Bacillus sp. UNCCL13]SFQ79693.1 g-D-glutamyl-meso-diaminopimelate peptidase [Bacillus sp. cl95]
MKVRVREGDTYWYFSNLFNIPLPLLMDANRHLDPACLLMDDEIKIPGFKIKDYKIKKDDTFWKLALKNQIRVEILLYFNPGHEKKQLQIGDSIKLPIKVSDSSLMRMKKYTSEQLYEDILKLEESFPFIEVQEVGKSVLGKSIPLLRIGKGKKKVLMNASFHANEWITTAILMDLVHEYVITLTNNHQMRGINTFQLYNSVELTVVPMVNPDGVDLVLNGPIDEIRGKVSFINRGYFDFTHWKANINGVDLNNQYPAKWEVEKERKEPKVPAPRDYPGDDILTEPEAKAMADLAHNEMFHRMVAFHTQGKEFYWGYEGYEPSESKGIAEEFERVSGYKAIQYVDSHAGYKDWFIQEFKRPAFTLELGKGINPLPLSQYEEIYRDVSGIFLAALYM